MKSSGVFVSVLAVVMLVAQLAVSAGKEVGQVEFEARCAACHPQGGNTINPSRTLDVMTRNANGVKGVKEIVNKIRKPGPGMKAYDRKELSDAKTRAIAEYIIKTFK